MNWGKNILLILGLAASIAGNGQNSNFYWERATTASNRLEGKLTGTMYYVTAQSNSYFFLHDEWHDGTILLEDSDLFTDMKIRYLAYGDELVAYNETLRNLFIADKNKVARFTIFAPEGERNFVRLYFDGLFPGYRYFEELYAGDKSLVAFHHVEEYQTNVYTDKNGKLRDSEYKMNVSYFMYSDQDGFRRINPKRRSFLRAFPDRKKEIRRLFRRNNLAVLDRYGMIQAFNLLDEAGFLH